MRKITEQEFSARYDSLPEELQDSIYSIDTKAAAQEIAGAEQLHIDQTGALNYLIALVMLGFIELEQFGAEVERELNVDKRKADAIMKRVNEKIFLPIRELFKKVDTPQGKAQEAPSVASPTPESVDRASMLKEIENPAPAASLAWAPAPTPPLPATALPANKAEPGAPVPSVSPSTAISAAPAEKKDITAEKLRGTTFTTTEDLNLGRDRSSYKVDPYREPPE